MEVCIKIENPSHTGGTHDGGKEVFNTDRDCEIS